jgi:heat shock protein HtpX
LYQLVSSISDAYGGGSVPSIIVTGDFNASLSRVGWRNAKVLCFGLPLWTTLQPQEKVALLAHELAHSVNGDLTRTFLVGSAIDSLNGWYQVIRPDHIWLPGDVWGIGLATVPINLIRGGVSNLVELLALGMAHLFWSDSQRAEYLADYLASTISGTDAMVSVLGKLHLGVIFQTTVDQTVRRRGIEGESLLERFKCDLEAVPGREIQRIKRRQNLETSRLDSTHPPTRYRTEFLKAHTVTEAKITLSTSEMDQVDGELSAIQEEIERKVLDAHRARLHYDS